MDLVEFLKIRAEKYHEKVLLFGEDTSDKLSSF